MLSQKRHMHLFQLNIHLFNLQHNIMHNTLSLKYISNQRMLVQVCNAHNFNTITKRNQHEKALYAVNKIQSKLNQKKKRKKIDRWN